MGDRDTVRTRGRVIGLSGAALDALMPFHLWVGATGQVVHAGRTLDRITGGAALVGAAFFEIAEVLRPARVTTMEALALCQGGRIKLRLAPLGAPDLFAMPVALPAGAGVFLNLAPGAALIDLVRRFDLTLDDFAPTELTAEMLFLIEAKEAGRKLPLRELGSHPETGVELSVMSGRYGPYVTDGTVNATIPKGTDPEEVDLAMAIDLLADKAAKGGGRGKRGKGRGTSASGSKTRSKKTSRSSGAGSPDARRRSVWPGPATPCVSWRCGPSV